MSDDSRHLLLAAYQAALAAVDGRACVRNALALDGPEAPQYVVAIGKAATAMLAGVLASPDVEVAAGLLITKHGHGPQSPLPASIRVIESSHPEPTQVSLDAGAVLLEFIAAVPADGELLFLISGGTSSLVEVLADGISLEDLQRANRWLLASGLDIHAINFVRKALSRIKGGRLADYLDGRTTRVMLISDVPGDDPATIGSGLLVPEILLETEAPFELPDWLAELVSQARPAPQSGDACFETIDVQIIAALEDAKQAAAEYGRRHGLDVYQHAAVITGDAVMVGRQLACQLLDGPAGLHVWGGETTVTLPPAPGRGGRNQHLALAAAIELEDESGVLLLAAGTDGSDGPGDDAGALVDGDTIRRCGVDGLDPLHCLHSADSGNFLAASGDLINTGPTGTNVMDLVLGFKSE